MFMFIHRFLSLMMHVAMYIHIYLSIGESALETIVRKQEMRLSALVEQRKFISGFVILIATAIGNAKQAAREFSRYF